MQVHFTAPQTYYVYTYAHPDGTVFYVGKGTNGRIADHEREARGGCRCRKCHVIREIWESGKPVQKRIVFETLNELEALEHEKTLIDLYACSQLANVRDNPYIDPPVIQEIPVSEKASSTSVEPVKTVEPVMPRAYERPFDLKQAAKALGVIPRTVVRLVERGELPGFKVGDVWRFYPSDVRKYVQDQKDQARKQSEKQE